MGAVHKLDLTSDVTHLVVGDTDTPKYKFVARERSDVKCILPSWIEAARASWMEGGETNLEELNQLHRLPTFNRLRLCVTGFDDLVHRKQIEEWIKNNGGEYRGNLTKDITHLVAKEAKGAKYDFAIQWGIRTVGVEWLEQSMERGMVLDESLYQLSIAPEERGRDAWIRRSESTTSLGKRARDEDGPQNARKLRRTASARLSSQNIGFWSELASAPVKSKEQKEDAWHEQPADTTAEVMPSKSEGARVAPTANNKQQLLQRSSSESQLGNSLGKSFSSEGLFYGKTVVLYGFEEKKAAVIQNHLQSHGAEIVEDASRFALMPGPGGLWNRLLLIPHSMSVSDVALSHEIINKCTVVTDMWVERCIYKKKLEDPRTHATSTPFAHFPIKGFENLALCSTGFQGIDLLHASKTIKLMGGAYEEYFTPKSSVLVCNSVVPGNEKLSHAQVWAIPAVKANWLWDSIQQGKLLPYRSYLVQPIENPNRPSEATEEPRKEDPAPKARRPDSKPPEIRKPPERNATPKDRYKDLSEIQPPTPISHEASTRQDTEKSCKDEPQTSAIYKDDDNPVLPESVPQDSSNTIAPPSAPTPLKEITPNSSPPKQPPPSKSTSPIKTKPPPQQQPQDPPSVSEDSSLGPAISSLLAAHQRSNHNRKTSNNEKAPQSSDQPPYRRRRRQLFGRAPSNLSSHSMNLSRASSVDTMNTDGLGTPLEQSNPNSNSTTNINNHNNTNKPLPTPSDFPSHIYNASNDDDDPDRIDSQQHLQMTQLGYEDEDVAAWRERVAIKMSGGTVKEGKGGGLASGGTPGKKTGGAGDGVKGDAGGSLGIAKRTRLATRG
ncbi:DNA helicase [Lecanora helva]